MNTRTPRPAIFGEVLFDRFPDGHSILGGAPFNVAWHLHGFGLAPLMISAVGDDDAGQQICERMQHWGMDRSGVQVCESYPTGKVEVSFNNGEPAYEITENQAYDHIHAETAKAALSNAGCAMLYHGTLIERAEESRQTLHALLGMHNAKSFVDINLRPPWWERDAVLDTLRGAVWVKLNQDELATVLERAALNDNDIETAARQLYTVYDLELLIVTCGGAGAFLVTREEIVHAPPVTGIDVVDTVGAGDAFSSVMIAGMLQDWPLAVTLRRALDFAAAICRQKGATSFDETLYTDFSTQWLDAD